jgi:hypothetical protein
MQNNKPAGLPESEEAQRARRARARRTSGASRGRRGARAERPQRGGRLSPWWWQIDFGELEECFASRRQSDERTPEANPTTRRRETEMAERMERARGSRRTEGTRPIFWGGSKGRSGTDGEAPPPTRAKRHRFGLPFRAEARPTEGRGKPGGERAGEGA